MLIRRLLNPNVTLKQRLRQATNIALEFSFGRAWQLAHIVEYPKCGGSWVRNMLRTYRGTERFWHQRLVRRRDVIMAHSLYRRRFSDPILVVRDPRDVYVSFYHYEISFERRDVNAAVFRHFHHEPARPLHEDFADYLQAKLRYPSHPWFFYRDFVAAWRGKPRTCVIRYEDCLADPAAQLTRLLQHLGEPVDRERVRETVEKTSFSAVTREKYGASREAGEADNTHFHRKGVAGDWQNYFDHRACRLLEEFDGGILRQFGYESDGQWVRRYLAQSKGAPPDAASIIR